MAPTPSPAPSNQQFLSSVLSQRGPSSLPYSEDVKWLIRQHLVSLSDSFPSLQPETAIFTHNDGRTVNLLQATGTIPMIFHSVTYNIPIVIWLMESYPRHPPWVFVNPTRDMIIKRPHPHVNPSGLVSVPYLQNWIYPSSNLVDLARNLGHLFGRDPPLYSRRPNSSPNSNSNPSISTSASFGSSSVVSSSNIATPRPAIPPRVFHPPYGHSPVTEDPVEVYKRNAINKLVEMAHGDVIALRKTREAEIEGMFSAQAALRRREEDLFKGLDEMMGEKESLEQQLQMVLMNSDVLEGWLRENEGKTRSIGNVAVDNAFEPCDPLSKQMLECTSSDLAIEDVIYSLDKGVQEGLVPFDQYLRNVRLLSREQFFHRAISAKVRATQMHAHVTSMASRTTHYAA